jgi:hypothetical protein
MPIAGIKMPSVALGLLVCVVCTLLSSSADARKTYKQRVYQRAYVGQGYANPTPSITVIPRNTPAANVVCWTPCGQPGAIVMGADPDPFIRSQILRDASGFFGGGGK